ncbi:aminotransferase class I/II-fold pyridoxal phosphate-dependent enzyme [Candidatus Nitrosotalea okcheonensis]|uniref:8-amino-7-oxononanoate synthase n=1 Tax=Candidatus Nitrosotalea okcheonensis TaxID=1903276 RepID=A0A2H1FDM9_9ARCH|nr:pyridoxal phosphate-dependent aminotransferase family protein [Candidatus Nitrosotalea okcheonensis]SMH70865.1 8-amino-7-oxononanoate synthase [Candidatus Nitrosotalea okcheonensis]
MKPRTSFISKRLEQIKKANLYRTLVYNKVSGPYITIKGKKLINLSSNDYLGLNSTPTLSQIQSSSRLISGNDVSFKKLENNLARHKSKNAALVFPTGYMANLGAISILTQKNDLILSDEFNHASIIDACRLSNAKKTIYKHNDVSDLEKKLRKKAQRKFVVTEGIFSMNGDFARLDEITKLCQENNAFLLLDDAHGDFVAGKDGKGSADHFRVTKNVDIYTSSMSKALGVFGGYIAASNDIIDLAVNTSRPFIYTSALPSFLADMALKRFLSDREKKRLELWSKIEQFSKGLQSIGYKMESPSQIMPVIIGSERKALEFGKYLKNNGIFAQPIRYPTVSLGSARIRISVTNWLSEDMISKALDIFEKAGKKFGIT